MSASKDHTPDKPQDSANSEHDAVLQELEGLGTDAALLREWKARLKNEPARHPDPAQSERLRQAILKQTVEDSARSGPLPASQKRFGQRRRLWTPLAAAAVLGAVLIGAWFALRPQAGPECQSLVCMLDALTAQELLDLHAQTTASDQRLDDADWAFAAGAFAEGESDNGPEGEPANTSEGGTATDAHAPIDLDATDLEQLEWDAMPLDDAALDALEEALLGS